MMPEIEASIVIFSFWALIGYVAGSIPFGLVLARIMGLGNLREIGSGSIGATNVLRTGSKAAAALTLLFDALKGAIPVLLARAYAGEDAAQVTGLAALLGHCYPVWLAFKGGKAVATAAGILLAICWPIGLAAFGAWALGVAVTRISSVGAIFAALVTPLAVLAFGLTELLVLVLVVAVLLLWRHRANISRLMDGKEPKIGSKS